jgi:hypothetical protein
MPNGAFAILAFKDDQLKVLGEMTILFASLEDAITKYAKTLLTATRGNSQRKASKGKASREPWVRSKAGFAEKIRARVGRSLPRRYGAP